MRICIVAEGCYPYVVGGVSSWINSMINGVYYIVHCGKSDFSRKV